MPRSAPWARTTTPPLGVYLGGTFWDGRTTDLAHQAQQPPLNPDEMDNTPTNGIYPPVFGGYSALLAQKLQSRPYTPLFKQIYGEDVFTKYTPQQIYQLILPGDRGVPGHGRGLWVQLEVRRLQIRRAAEETVHALRIRRAREDTVRVGPNPTNDPTYGGAQCFQCHSSAALARTPVRPLLADGKETFTMYCYANIGVPEELQQPLLYNDDDRSRLHDQSPRV